MLVPRVLFHLDRCGGTELLWNQEYLDAAGSPGRWVRGEVLDGIREGGRAWYRARVVVRMGRCDVLEGCEACAEGSVVVQIAV
jgi:hypothetical protein